MGSLFGGGSSAANQAAQQARADEAARQARISSAVGQINQNFGQFNDDFYGGRATAYRNYATPQLEEQYQKARDELTYALSRGGLLNSSVAGQRMADLSTQYNRQRQAIVDQGLSLANQARSDVESARSSLVGQAQSAADPGSVAGGAAARAATLTAAPTFSPLGPLFANVTAGLASAAQGARDQTAEDRARQALGAMLYQTNPSAGSASVISTR